MSLHLSTKICYGVATFFYNIADFCYGIYSPLPNVFGRFRFLSPDQMFVDLAMTLASVCPSVRPSVRLSVRF